MITNAPVIVLSYGYTGAGHVQQVLAADACLGCTSGTGVIPLCATAAETWRRIEGRDGLAISSLAAATIRAMITAQVSAILVGIGKTRWCELATAPPSSIEPFRQLFPGTHFVCVHRSCLDVVRVGVRAQPWGLQGHAVRPYAVAYPGNNVAALAAYWADSTEQLLAFEEANRETVHRVRYEDVTAHADEALASVRTALKLGHGESAFPESDSSPPEPAAEVPVEMIPQQLHERIRRLHAQLDYPACPLEAWPPCTRRSATRPVIEPHRPMTWALYG